MVPRENPSVTRFRGQLDGAIHVESLPFLLRPGLRRDRRSPARRSAVRRLGELSATGLQILVLVRSGRTAAALAETLGISHHATARVVVAEVGTEPHPWERG